MTSSPSPDRTQPWVVGPDEPDLPPPVVKGPPPLVPITTVIERDESVAWTTIGDEVVVYSAQDGMSWVFNASAGLLWQCVDGSSTVEEILRDLADVFEVPAPQVIADFAPAIAEWVADGIARTTTDDLAELVHPAPPTDQLRTLPEPPNDCGKAVRSMWAHSVVIGVGQTAITVASEDPEFVDSLQPWAIEVPNDDWRFDMVDFVLDADPNRNEQWRGWRYLPSVRHGSCSLFRLRDVGMLEVAIRRVLASFEPVTGAGQLRVRLMPVIRDGVVVLLPPGHAGSVSHRWYETQGVTPIYTWSSVIDVDTWTVNVDPPLGLDSTDDAPTQVPIVDWWLPSVDPTVKITPGEALAHVLGLAVGMDQMTAEDVLRMARTAVDAHVPSLAPAAPDRIIEQIDPATATELRADICQAISARLPAAEE